MSEELPIKLKSKPRWKLLVVIVVVLAFAFSAVLLVPSMVKAKDREELLNLGEKYLSELEYDQAIATYLEIIEIDPKCEEAYVALMEVYTITGRYKEAEQLMEMARETFGSDIVFLEEEIEELEHAKRQAEVTSIEVPTSIPTPEPTATSMPTNTPNPEPTSTPTPSVVSYENNEFNYNIENGEVTITLWKAETQEVVIPEAVDGCPVTGIGEGAFDEQDNLTSVEIPESVTSIGEDALGDSVEAVYVKRDSYAESWAERNGYPVRYIGEVIETATPTPEPTSTPTPTPTVVPYPSGMLVPTTIPVGFTLPENDSEKIVYVEVGQPSSAIEVTIFSESGKFDAYVSYSVQYVSEEGEETSIGSVGIAMYASDAINANNTTAFLAEKAGKYAVHIRNAVHINPYYYSGTNLNELQMTYRVIPPDEHEPNGTVETATVIKENEFTFFNLLGDGDTDYFVLELAENYEKLEVSIGCESGRFDSSLVYNVNRWDTETEEMISVGAVWGMYASNAIRNNSTKEYKIDGAGTYYIKVTNASNANSIYYSGDNESCLYIKCRGIGDVVTSTPVPTAVPTATSTPTPLPEQSNEQYFYYEKNDEGGITITGLRDETIVELIIPKTINDLPVTRIGDAAFAYCTSIERVVIPEGVEGIYSWLYTDGIWEPREKMGCFEYCTNLKEVILPSTLKELGCYTFYGCSALEEINLPNAIEHIKGGTFSYCTSLVSVKLPENLLTLGVSSESEGSIFRDGVFEGCSSLKEIVIPDSVTEIGREAFNECINLESFPE